MLKVRFHYSSPFLFGWSSGLEQIRVCWLNVMFLFAYSSVCCQGHVHQTLFNKYISLLQRGNCMCLVQPGKTEYKIKAKMIKHVLNYVVLNNDSESLKNLNYFKFKFFWTSLYATLMSFKFHLILNLHLQFSYFTLLYSINTLSTKCNSMLRYCMFSRS